MRLVLHPLYELVNWLILRLPRMKCWFVYMRRRSIPGDRGQKKLVERAEFQSKNRAPWKETIR